MPCVQLWLPFCLVCGCHCRTLNLIQCTKSQIHNVEFLVNIFYDTSIWLNMKYLFIFKFGSLKFDMSLWCGWGSFGLLGLFQLACGLVVNQMLAY